MAEASTLVHRRVHRPVVKTQLRVISVRGKEMGHGLIYDSKTSPRLTMMY